MVVSPNKHQKLDLQKIASQLASIHVLIVPTEGRLLVRATAKFDTRSFEAGTFRVSVGLKQAILHLELPSFDIESAYQSTLPKETWSENWKHFDSTSYGGKLKIGFGAKIAEFFSFGAEGSAAKNKSDSAEQKASAPYRIVSSIPSGWRIGTELGDPRDPRGTLPGGLEHCLHGEYFSGKSGEHGEGTKEKSGAFALCELRPRVGGNDLRIVATLFGVSGSLQVEIASLEPTNNPLQQPSDRKEREEQLRKAFIEICLRRAEAAAREGARTETMLSGEFYLSHQEIRAPITPQTKPTGPNAEASIGTGSQIIKAPTKARGDAKRRET